MTIKLKNIQVAVRLRDDICKATSALPAARAKVELASARTLLVSQEDSQSNFEFDACVMGIGEDSIQALHNKLDLTKNLSQLWEGYSMGLIGIGGEGERAGAYSSFLLSTLNKCKEQFEHFQLGGQHSTDISYAIYGLSDSSCIDLLTYARMDTSEVEAIVRSPWAPLNKVESMDEVYRALEQGYSLPCVTLVRFLVRSINTDSQTEEGNSATMSTLLLADLGSLGSGAALEKSLAQIRAMCASAVCPEPIDSSQSLSASTIPSVIPLPLGTCLSLFLEEYLGGGCGGGNAHAIVIGDVPISSTSRSLQTQLFFLSALRRLKNRPTPLRETAEMRELAQLMQQHERLELEHQSVRQELKNLQKALKVAEIQHFELEAEKGRLQDGNELCRWEYEYELTKVSMEKVAVHERIRQCEIDLVKMEASRLFLVAEMEERKRNLAELEDRLLSSQHEKEKIEKEFNRQVEGLNRQLHDAQTQLHEAQGEKALLLKDLEESTGRVTKLEDRIKQVQEKMDIRQAENLREQTTELKKLRTELVAAQESEGKLAKKLSDLEKNSYIHQDAVRTLENKLTDLRVENASLAAKLEVLTTNPINSSTPRKLQSPEISRTLRLMEEKWQEERSAMKDVMDELRKIIASKDQALAAALVVPTLTERPTINSKPSRAVTFADKPLVNVIKEETSKSKPEKTTKSRGRPSNLSKSSKIEEIEEEPETIEKDSTLALIAQPSKLKGIKGESSLKQIEPSKKATDNKKTVPVSAVVLQTTSLKRKSSLVDDKNDREDIPMNKIDTIITSVEGTKKGGVRLGPKTKSALASTTDVKSKPLGKILEVPQGSTTLESASGDLTAEDEVPGTPQKTFTSKTASTNNRKPSSFIPGVSGRKPTSAMLDNEKKGESSSSMAAGLFASFNFSGSKKGEVSTDGGGGGVTKRIKLPTLLTNKEKESKSVNPAVEKPLLLETRKANIDPTVFSTIMGTFTMPTLGKK